MTGLLFLFVFSDREVFRAVAAQDSVWSNAATWIQTDNTPGEPDRVMIPGRNQQDRSVRILAGTNAVASSVMVGCREASVGGLSIAGSLTVSGTASDQERQPGRLYVGRQRGEGWVSQQSGSSVSAKSVRIGFDTRGDGSYFIQDATLSANSVQVAIGKHTGGVLDVFGNSTVATARLLLGRGRSRVRFAASANAVPTIVSSKQTELSGTLRVKLDALARTPNEITLIQNAGTVTGGFRRVLIESESQYELSYFGGDGNDVALIRSTVANNYDAWLDSRLSESNPQRSPLDDPDGDGVPNIGEYKLGCCPRTNEGAAFRVEENSQGLRYIKFFERTDRPDVRVVPQASVDGRVWSSDLVTTKVVSTFGNTQTTRATATKSDLQFRLAFELLPKPSARPNVLFVMIDDLNDWTEILGGHSQALTPNLNRIAARGITFTNAHSNAALCNPSRVSMITGRLPNATGVYDNSSRLLDSPVLQGVVTLPEQFQRNGYRITGGGKFFHGDPFLSTWDEYFPSLTKSRPSDPTPDNKPLNGITETQGNFDWGIVPVSDDRMGDVKVADWAQGQLQQAYDKPFLQICGFYRPHLPFYAPPEYFAPWKEEDVRLPNVLTTDRDDLSEIIIERLDQHRDHEQVINNKQWQKAVHAYLACIYFADTQLGRILDALDHSPQFRNTILVVASDHGWQLGEKQAWRKSTLWDRATRIPLVVVAPGTTTPGTTCHEPVSLIDIYPTLNELCGFTPAGELDGNSFVPLLSDPNQATNRHVLTTHLFKNHGIRTKDWRFIQYAEGHEELYDHSTDPHEWHNLADSEPHQSQLHRMRQLLPTFNHEYVGPDE